MEYSSVSVLFVPVIILGDSALPGTSPVASFCSPYHWEGDYCAFGKLQLSSKVCRPDVMLLICRLFFPLSPSATHTTCGLCCRVTAEFVPGGGLVHSLCRSPFSLKPERNNFSCCLWFRQYRTRKVSQNSSVDSYVSWCSSVDFGRFCI